MFTAVPANGCATLISPPHSVLRPSQAQRVHMYLATPPAGTGSIHTPLHSRCRGYEITATDLLTVFSELDAACTGAVPLADFEAAMLRLGYTPEAAARLFAALDTNRDGVLTFADWSSEPARHVAHALAHRLIRQRLVGNDPVRAQRPPSSVRPPPPCSFPLNLSSARPPSPLIPLPPQPSSGLPLASPAHLCNAAPHPTPLAWADSLPLLFLPCVAPASARYGPVAMCASTVRFMAGTLRYACMCRRMSTHVHNRSFTAALDLRTRTVVPVPTGCCIPPTPGRWDRRLPVAACLRWAHHRPPRRPAAPCCCAWWLCDAVRRAVRELPCIALWPAERWPMVLLGISVCACGSCHSPRASGQRPLVAHA